ncbi:UbiA prenyltransferase family [Mycena floridula]|nr:UbiA prenyltransferase family [Mycena floridula]
MNQKKDNETQLELRDLLRHLPAYTLSTIRRHIHTAILFTWTDYMTVLLPVMVFGCAAAPFHSIKNLLRGLAWVWLHLLLCNVSNQARSEVEDSMNHPWRPLPSGRVTQAEAIVLRWVTALFCLLWSCMHGLDMVAVTLTLIVVTWVYNEGGLAGTVVGKNLCNVGGYITFEIGATKIMGVTRELDTVSITATLLSGALILTTIQAQDFPDVEGDAASGRLTFPLYAPELARALTFFAIPARSVGLAWYWGPGPICQTLFVCLGSYIGLRYYLWRTEETDRRSYFIFNFWLMCAHLLPFHARSGVFSL